MASEPVSLNTPFGPLQITYDCMIVSVSDTLFTLPRVNSSRNLYLLHTAKATKIVLYLIV